MNLIATAVLAMLVVGMGSAALARLKRLGVWVEDVDHQLRAWQAAHNYQLDELDRRMLGVESAAANAEREARIVSGQIVELGQGIVERLSVVEQLRADVLAAQGRVPSPRPYGSGGR